jgi:hypothetical protein
MRFDGGNAEIRYFGQMLGSVRANGALNGSETRKFPSAPGAIQGTSGAASRTARSFGSRVCRKVVSFTDKSDDADCWFTSRYPSDTLSNDGSDSERGKPLLGNPSLRFAGGPSTCSRARSEHVDEAGREITCPLKFDVASG